MGIQDLEINAGIAAADHPCGGGHINPDQAVQQVPGVVMAKSAKGMTPGLDGKTLGVDLGAIQIEKDCIIHGGVPTWLLSVPER